MSYFLFKKKFKLLKFKEKKIFLKKKKNKKKKKIHKLQ